MSKINWAELMSLVDEQLEELSENDLVVFEEPINNTTPDLHKNISDNKIVSESQEEFFSCITTSDCYRKIKKYFIDREDEEVIAKDFDRKVALAIKSEQVEMVAFVEAWNKLVGDGDLWHEGEGSKVTFIYTPIEIENVLKVISNDYAYDIKGNNIITRHETDLERATAVTDLTKKLAKLGYVHSLKGGTHGRLELKGTDGRRGVFITFKWVKGAEKGGARAALSGMSKEVELAEKIISSMKSRGSTYDLKKLSQFIKTAGAGHGSDLQIKLPGSKPLNIEVKTSIGADFGQFKFGYDLNEKKWVAIKTGSWFKGKDKKGELIPAEDKQNLFNDIFANQVLSVLPENPFRGINIETAPLNIKNGIVVGIKTSKTTSALKNKLAKKWFDGKESVYIAYSIDKLATYYANKGDGYIQISREGLYGLTQARTTALGLNYTFLDAMEKGTVSARVRVRIKPHGGTNEVHSFTAALKVRGKIAKSNIDLDTPEGIIDLVDLVMTPQTQKEHLTGTRLSYIMLSEMINELTSDE